MPVSVRITKRFLDFIIATIVLFVLSPILTIIAFAIKFDSPGPVFYKQRRVKMGGGKNPEEFYIYKFRTMSMDAEKHSGAVNATTSDARVTKMGKFLRPSRIDEIPNLINVMFSEMSIVGPRADRVEIFNSVDKTFPNIWERTKHIKPGITGSAQLALLSDGSIGNDTTLTRALPDSDTDKPVDSFRYKMYHDFAYTIKLSTFWSFLITDLTIMAKTPIIMFFRKTTI